GSINRGLPCEMRSWQNAHRGYHCAAGVRSGEPGSSCRSCRRIISGSRALLIRKTDDGGREEVCFWQILLSHGLKQSVARVSISPNGNESPLPGSPARSARFCENLSMKLQACS